MAIEYTKGEWEIIEYPVQGHFIGNGEVTIATIHEDIQGSEANAHLIAAAPIGDELANAVMDMNFDDYDDYLELKEIAKRFKEKANPS